ncbi:MAG: heparinase II/III family protein [Eubacteriales bacterium]|nr:heparinase II/III family protein [Eubacteriales bacterium]
MFYELAEHYQNPLLPFHPAASIEDRDAWENLHPELKKRLIEDGNACLPVHWPMLLATDYLDFTRTGNRERFQEKLFARRTILNTLVLAECVEHQGRFLDEIVNGIYLICEESAWQLPAHNSYIRDTPQLPLPDVTRPVIDLFAAETAAVLSTVHAVMKPALDQYSPFISSMLAANLEQRIFTPYEKEHFWWMGDGKSQMNNWTVWCTQNVLLSASLSHLPEARMAAIFRKACRSIDYFLDEYGEDGCCDEGAQYYRHAGLCLFGCLEILNGITDGQFAGLYENTKVRNIAAYIQKVHVDGPYYINFSDCSPVAGRCNAREFVFGLHTRNVELMKLAAEDYFASEDPVLTEEHNLYYRLLTVFWDRTMRAFVEENGESGDSGSDSHDLYFPSVGLFLARDQHFCLAVKAGDNDDSHNHNDTGSFTLYKDGLPMFVDIGVETYQQKTFSPQRYEIWTMQSQYHNVMSFAGCRREDAAELPYGYAVGFGDSEDGQPALNVSLRLANESERNSASNPLVAAIQHNGPQYAARDVRYGFTDTEAWIQMELADAYPDTKVRSYVRTVRMEKNHQITITDRTDCAPLTPVLSLITYETPSWDPEHQQLSVGSLGGCRIEGATQVVLERLPITDKRLQTAWKHDLWRVLVTADNQEITLTIDTL